VLCLGVSAVLALVAQAGADAGGACPDARAVWLAARPLLGGVAPPSEPTIAVDDRGAEYAVTVNGSGAITASTRVLRDPARDCAARTRAAAVFVALVLRPEEPRPPAPPPSPRPSLRVAPGAGVLVGMGGDGVRALASLTAELRGRRWGGEGAVGFASPRTSRYADQSVSAWLAPAQLGVVYRRQGERWGGAAHLDAVAMGVRGTLTTAPGTPASFGVQVGGGPGVELTRQLSPAWSLSGPARTRGGSRARPS
jgi:hypothetical protein